MKRDIILVPVDFSEPSVNAIHDALELAGEKGKVRLLHVLPPLESISPGVVWGDLSDDSREQHVRDFAKTFLDEHGFQDLVFDVRIGPPGHTIADYAADSGTDLIVISSHGYHGIKRMLLGSVAEAVIRHAQCAVLVIRRTDAE
ncbi:MAG: universal stress protein [Planctomycetaceae bacterium]